MRGSELAGTRVARIRVGLSVFGLAAILVVGAALMPIHDSSAASVSSKLVPSSGAFFGIYPGARDGRTSYGEMAYLESLAGRTFDLDRMYHRWDKGFPTRHEYEAVKAGRIPALSWAATRQDGVKIPFADIASGKQDAVIAARADALKAFGHKLFLAFQLEPEDDSAWGTPTEYRAAWRRIVSIFRARGATNVVFVWNMMAYTFQSTSGRNPLDWYPGDDVIDWLAADGYNWYGSTHVQNGNAPWRSFAAIFQPFYDWGKNRGKPLAVWETGVLEDTKTPDPLRKAQWFKDAAATVKNWPQMKAVVYFNAHGWYFDSSNNAISAYKAVGADPYFKPLSTTSADSITPTVSVAAPANGATVAYKSPVSITAAATDNTAVSKVEIAVNGTVRCTLTATPYTCTWWAWTKSGTQNVIRATAYDAAGNKASQDITVETRPAVKVTSPSSGGKVTYGTNFEITSEAFDALALSKVEFSVNGTVRCTDTSAPYTCTSAVWSKSGTKNIVRATAYDANGKTASHEIPVYTA